MAGEAEKNLRCNDVVREQNKLGDKDHNDEREKKQKEEELFLKVNKYFKMHTHFDHDDLKNLLKPPLSSSVSTLEKIAAIICKDIFNTPVQCEKNDKLKYRYVNFYNLYGHLSVIKGQRELRTAVTLGEMLTSTFINMFTNRFNYKERLQALLKNREISKEKKQQWLIHQSEQQRQLLRETDPRSILFLTTLYESNPVIVYKAMEVLLKHHDSEAIDYLNSLLKAIKTAESSKRYTLITKKIHESRLKEKGTKLGQLLQNISKLAQKNRVLQLSRTKFLLNDFLRPSTKQDLDKKVKKEIKDKVKTNFEEDNEIEGFYREYDDYDDFCIK